MLGAASDPFPEAHRRLAISSTPAASARDENAPLCSFSIEINFTEWAPFQEAAGIRLRELFRD